MVLAACGTGADLGWPVSKISLYECVGPNLVKVSSVSRQWFTG